MTENYKSTRIIDGKPRQVIVDENEKIINRNPSKEELRSVSLYKKEESRSLERYTDQELLNYIVKFYEDNGRVPTANDFLSDPQYPSSPTYRSHFGSWNDALEMAGFRPNKKNNYTKQELLESLEKFYEENSRIPSTRDLRNNPKYPNFISFNRQFGNLENALKLLGLENRNNCDICGGPLTKPTRIYNENGGRTGKWQCNKCYMKNYEYKSKRYTDEELINYLKKFYEEKGRVPVRRDFINSSEYPNYQNYTAHFETWNSALKTAGLKVYDPFEKNYTDEQLLDELRRFKREEGRSPGQMDFNNNPEYPGFVTYQRRFGTWNAAIKLAGLETNVGGTEKEYTKEELLDLLLYFKEDNKRIPVESDFISRPEYPSFTTYVRYFGSWGNALKLVGMDLDTSVRKGILDTTAQRGRMWELCIFESFEKEGAIDHSGKNIHSPIDGTCPNNQNYDAKVAELIYDGWPYDLRRGDRSKIQWFYLGAFSKDYKKLLYAWRIPVAFFKNDTTIMVGLKNNRKYNIERLKIYEITDKIVKTFEEMSENFERR